MRAKAPNGAILVIVPLHRLPDLVALLHRRPGIDLGALDREGDLLLLLIHREHLHLDLLADLEHLAGMVDAAPGELADMHQAVGAAQIDERAEVGQVADRALCASRRPPAR